MMDQADEAAHIDHIRQTQDHLKWRAEHMRAFATLRRVEAALLTHEAQIISHDAEIQRHEEQIAHGASHAPKPPADDHSRFAQAHDHGGEHHAALVEAILKLEALLPKDDAG